MKQCISSFIGTVEGEICNSVPWLITWKVGEICNSVPYSSKLEGTGRKESVMGESRYSRKGRRLARVSLVQLRLARVSLVQLRVENVRLQGKGEIGGNEIDEGELIVGIEIGEIDIDERETVVGVEIDENEIDEGELYSGG